ncbi:MAG: beta-galactosidase [Cyclobacteriaceae bacterium]|nr:beta-galactosidase [Cyclobacteriaceae bacterium]
MDKTSRRNFIKTTGLTTGGLILAPFASTFAGTTASDTANGFHLPFRQVHLDFHTSEHVEGIGKNFNAEQFAKTLKQAYVNSITCFGRCHHGFIYYDSKKFPERIHPHLVEKHLLEKQIKVCHENDIRVPVYLTIQWDHYTAMRHPEWLMRDTKGAPLGPSYFEPGFYRRLCVNSPYRDFLKESISDLFASVQEVDGLFLDIVGTLECSCRYCTEQMEAAGLEPSNQQDRRKFAVDTINGFKHDLSTYIRAISPDAGIFYNSGHIGPYIKESLEDYSHLEMESLPSGSWGYIHFPLTSRYVRTLGEDYLGMTGKFHTAWGDFYSYKNQPALEYECFMMLALGAKCSIGDQLPPDGRLDEPTYELIGKVYEQVARKEKWCTNVRAVVDIAIVTPEALDPSSFSGSRTPGSIKGALRMLQESGKQFNVIDFEQDFNAYKLIILPDEIVLTDAQARKFDAYVANGGKILASFQSGLDTDKKQFILDLGVEKTGDGPKDRQGEYAVGKIYGSGDYAEYLLPEDNALGKALSKSEYVMYIKGLPIKAVGSSEVMANTIRSYFDRTYEHFFSHRQAPSSGTVSHPAIVKGKGTMYFTHPIFTQYQHNAPKWCKTLVVNAIDSMLDNQVIRLDAPSTAQCTVNEQDGKYIVHVLHYIPERRGEQFDIIEDVIPIFNIRASVAFPKKARKVMLVPEMKSLSFETKNGRVEFVLPEIKGHQMVEIS